MDPRQSLFEVAPGEPLNYATPTPSFLRTSSPALQHDGNAQEALSFRKMTQDPRWVAVGASLLTVVILLSFSSSLFRTAEGNISVPTIVALALCIFLLVMFGPDLRGTYLNQT
jgi:hypothetical protein